MPSCNILVVHRQVQDCCPAGQVDQVNLHLFLYRSECYVVRAPTHFISVVFEKTQPLTVQRKCFIPLRGKAKRSAAKDEEAELLYERIIRGLLVVADAQP